MKTQMLALALLAAIAACAGETTSPVPQSGVSGSAPSISVSPAAPWTGGMASFSSASLPGGGERTWSFGDGGQASGVDVGHVYVVSGTYTVTVSVSDGRQATTTVTVSDPHKPSHDSLM